VDSLASLIASAASSDCSCSGLGPGGVDSRAGVGADCGVCSGYNSAFLSSDTTASASFCASATSGAGTASDTGAGVARGVVEGADSGVGVILRLLGALSSSTVSSSLSRLKLRDFSVKEGDSVVGSTEWAGAIRVSPPTAVMASDGATTTGEGEEVDEDGGGCTAGRGVFVGFPTAAAPHVHFSRSAITKYTSAFTAYAR
jgi:hypothetical protein